MIVDMERTWKYEADKIVLLALFAAGLVIARFMTVSRYTGPRKQGTKVIAEVKSKGISSFFPERRRRSFFVIRDAADRTTGFTADVVGPAAPPYRLGIQSAALLYIPRIGKKEQLMSFQSDERFSTFSWKSEVAISGRRSRKELLLGDEGVLTIGESGQGKRRGYEPAEHSIPDVLLDLVFSQMLDSGYKKIIVDAIDSDGQTTEVAIWQTKTAGPGPLSGEPEYELNVIFLDRRRPSQQVHLDAGKRISGISLQQDPKYEFERTTLEEVLTKIPEAARYIAPMLTASEPNQP